MTEQEFEDALKEIDWKLIDIGCGHRAVVNHLGERTELELYNGMLTTESRTLGGQTASQYGRCIVLYIELKSVIARPDPNPNSKVVSFMREHNDGVWLSLYNFSKDEDEAGAGG